MEHIGIDLHKTSSQLCILKEDGQLNELRIKSTRASFSELFAERPRALILVEASIESEWVTCHLEELGHEVIVADPNFAPMCATRDSVLRLTSEMPVRCARLAALGLTLTRTALPRSRERLERSTWSDRRAYVPAPSISR